MNCWQMLGLSPEATGSEVLSAHERLCMLNPDESRRQALDSARDEALRRIEMSFDALFGEAASTLPGEEERLWEELRHAQISGLERPLPEGASERLHAVTWLVQLVESPSDVLPHRARPASIGSAVLRMALHALEPKLTPAILNAWALSPHFDAAALTPTLILRIDDAIWMRLFSAWGSEHPLWRGPSAQTIALRRLRIDRDRSWVAFLNRRFSNDDLSDVEVLHLDFLTCLATGKSGLPTHHETRLLIWTEGLMALWHDEDRTELPEGPETGFLPIEAVDYLFALVSRICRLDDAGAGKRLQAKRGRAFIDSATLKIDSLRPFRHPIFLAWLAMGAALSWWADGWRIQVALAALAGYALITIGLVRRQFFMGPSAPGVSWTLGQLRKLEATWGFSPPHLWALLERVRDDGPTPLRRLKAAYLLRAMARPQVLAPWINAHLRHLPLRGGPIDISPGGA
ncbi:MAG: hypothetical protein AB7F75_10795 [Planctomycetota bacterium]